MKEWHKWGRGAYCSVIAFLATLLITGGCTTINTDDPSWEYPKEVYSERR